MKRIYALLTILVFGSVCNLSSIPLGNDEAAPDSPIAKPVPVDEGLTVVIRGEQLPDGTYKPAKIVRIPKLPAENYIPGMIQIKMKQAGKVTDGKTLSSSPVMAALAPYSVNTIRAPFERYAGPGFKYTDKYGISRIYEVQYSSGDDPYDVCRVLMSNPEIEYAVPVFVRNTCDFTPNDPAISNQWAVNKLQMAKAWDICKGDTGVVIGIVDSGVYWQHEDLAANMWTNNKEIPNNGVDEDSNGKVDDYLGWDLVGNYSGSGSYKEDNDPTNTKGTHGTHVAGCAAAVTNNGKGVAGIASNCRIMAVKCGSDAGTNAIYRGYDGIAYAAEMGAGIINCSWGGSGYSPAEQDVINQAVSMGCLVVVAAGNSYANIDDGGQYPACYDNVLCVGATTSSDKKASFSNYGFPVTVYTPGENIYSTMPANQYKNESGTSMASPITSGIAALVKSLHPEWTPIKILQQIRSTSDNVLASNESLRPTYYGRANAYKALNYNNNGSTNMVPGIAVESYSLVESDALSDNENKTLKINVKNYLYSAQNVKMTLTPVGSYLEVSQSSFNFGTIATDGSKEINITIRLKESNPWYLGTIPILVKFESGTYVNFQYISLPVEVTSVNNYTELVEFPEEYSLSVTSAQSKEVGNLWALGRVSYYGSSSGFIIYSKSNIPKMNYFQGTDVYYNICAEDENTAVMSGQTAAKDQAKLAKTTNGGTSWTYSTIDASLTQFINGVHFFDARKGILLGDPNSKGDWGLLVSNDSGKTWSQLSNVPAPLASEAGLNSVFYANENCLWFGTNKGRIIKSTNKGVTWGYSTLKDAVNIVSIAFIDNTNGFAIYTKSSSQGAPLYLATTTTAGSSWITDKYDFGAASIKPVKLLSLPSENRVYILCQTGQIFSTRYGTALEPVLTFQQGGVLNGALVSPQIQKGRMWILGQKFGYLDFKYKSENAVGSLLLTTGNDYNFPQTRLGENSTLQFKLKNSGNVEVKISEYTFTPGENTESDEFKIIGAKPSMLDAGDEKTLTIRFTPASISKKNATLTIKSDAEDAGSEIVMNITGEGIEKNDVPETGNLTAGLSVYPNPSNGLTKVSYFASAESTVGLTLTDIMGRQRMAGTYRVQPGINVFDIDMTSFEYGTYFLTIGENGHRSSVTILRTE